MKNGIIFLVVFALVVIIGYFCVRVVKNIQSQKIIDELYARPARGRGFILRVLRAAFGKKVIVGATVNVRGNQPATADAVMVTRSGIAVISIVTSVGRLDNPQRGPWLFYDERGGCTEVDNPYEKNGYMTEVLKNVLRRDGFVNIAFHSYVIVSNCRAVMPKYAYKTLLTENNMLSELNTMMAFKQLSYTEMRDVRMTVDRVTAASKAVKSKTA